jgi:hypothetical protein
MKREPGYMHRVEIPDVGECLIVIASADPQVKIYIPKRRKANEQDKQTHNSLAVAASLHGADCGYGTDGNGL